MKPTPIKPTDDLRRLFRGGSWSDSTAADGRAAFRFDITPTLRNRSFGFRTTQTGCRQQVLKVQP